MPGIEFFLDVDTLTPGENWRQSVDQALRGASVALVIVGARWRGEDGNRLLDHNDMVRHEIDVALRENIRIIPVLVDGARMPAVGELPPDVAKFADINAIEIRLSRFEDDVRNLVHAIGIRSLYRIATPLPGLRHLAVAALSGTVSAAIVTLISLILCKAITGRALSEYVGDDGATVIAVLGPIAGAALMTMRMLRRMERDRHSGELEADHDNHL